MARLGRSDFAAAGRAARESSMKRETTNYTARDVVMSSINEEMPLRGATREDIKDVIVSKFGEDVVDNNGKVDFDEILKNYPELEPNATYSYEEYKSKSGKISESYDDLMDEFEDALEYGSYSDDFTRGLVNAIAKGLR